MTPSPADMVARRNRRKQDLLLASALARHQAVGAVVQIGQRVDRVVGVFQQVRNWLLAPQLAPVAGVLASAAALVALRRVRLFRLMRWGLLGWRIAKLVSAVSGARRTAP